MVTFIQKVLQILNTGWLMSEKSETEHGRSKGRSGHTDKLQENDLAKR